MLLSGFFPQIVYTPLRGLTNFTVEPRVARLLALRVNAGNFKESDAKIRLFTGRKFYMTVHFFLTLRRHSPPFFETESLLARAFGARQFLRTLTGV